MKKYTNKLLAKLLIMLMLMTSGLTQMSPLGSYAATLPDENFDDDAGYSNATTQVTLDAIKYTLTGPGPDTLVTNVAPSGWGELGDGGSDNFISIMGIDTLKIEAADGSYFKLNGMEIGFCSVAGITITPENGLAITRPRAGDESYYTIDVSGNTDFQYIKSFTITGTDIIMNIDDLDFSPAVPPTHTLSYNGNGNTGGGAPIDGSSPYAEADSVAVIGNTGNLTKTGYTFTGWNTAANGSGTSYSQGNTFAMGSSNVTLYALWTENTYNVTYNGNGNIGGTVPTDGINYHNGDTATVIGNTGNLTCTGYTFTGWNTAANGSGTSYAQGNTFAMGSSNVTLYAQWTESTYNVTYNGNSNTGGIVPTDATNYHNGDTATVLGNSGALVRPGYTFAGWNTSADGTGSSYNPASTFAMGLSNVTLYAQWTPLDYTVTYNGNTNTGGAVPTDSQAYHITDSVAVLGNTGNLTKTGYTFAGWNTAADGSGTSYSQGNTFGIGSSNVTLYAQWTESTYNVTYNGNSNTGGTVPTDVTSYHKTNTVTVLGNSGALVRTGYTFAGWNTLADGTGSSYNPASTFAMGLSNVTLYAEWTPIDYTVTYNGNTNTGGAVPTDSHAYHITDSVMVLGNTGSLTKTGYTFTGWNTAANGSGTSYSQGNTFGIGGSNVTLYAQWTENVYNVTYNGNSNTGGAVPTDITSYHNTDTVTVLGNSSALLRTGYTFAGWNTLADGTGSLYNPASTFAMGLSNVTLYAEWTPIDYTVTYNGNTNTGGSVPTDSQAYHITDSVAVLDNTGSLTKTGYTFTGWNTAANGSGTSYSQGNIFGMGSSNVTLYAQWTENVYNVTYNGNSNTGGTVPTDVTSYHNTDTVTVLGNSSALLRTGYTFAGWNTLADGTGSLYNPASTFAMGLSNVTLYAEWTPIDYTVTYNGNTNTGGSVPTDSQAYHITDSVTVLDNTGSLTKTGYTFTGWNTAADGSGDYYNQSNTFNMGSTNVTFYAQWTNNNYHVNYNGNTNTSGTAPIDNHIYHSGNNVTALENVGNMAKKGYVFAGWNTAANGSGTQYKFGDTFKMGTSNISLFAQWTANKYAITYNGNGHTGGTVPVDGNSYHISDQATVVGNTGNLVKNSYTFTGWNTAANGSGMQLASGSSIAIDINNIVLYAKWTPNTSADVGSGNKDTGSSQSNNSSNTATNTPSPQQPQGSVIVIVNGKAQNAGTETSIIEAGKQTVTVLVDSKVIDTQINEAVKSNTSGMGNTIQVSIADKKSEVAKVELTGDMIKKLETHTFDVNIKRDNVEYIIPAEEFTISKVAENFGILETDLKVIKIDVKITKINQNVVAEYDKVVKSNGAELIFQPVEFEIVAKIKKADGTTGDFEISKFSNYVERVMELPAGVDPKKITTGIVFNTDATYSHVPTKVLQKDSKWYATINSLTNSDYAVVWNPVTVKSVENHWSKNAVNDMASRMVIFNSEHFNPNKAITRADFAEYIVRALGLYREGSTHENKFKDVSSNGERTLAILIANEYGIVNGYTDATFRPDQKITREEAMVMYFKAMKITKMTGNDQTRYQNYTDYTKVSNWADTYVKEVLSAHVFNGTSETTLSLKSNLTYAESAQAIKNLLVASKLINN